MINVMKLHALRARVASFRKMLLSKEIIKACCAFEFARSRGDCICTANIRITNQRGENANAAARMLSIDAEQAASFN